MFRKLVSNFISSSNKESKMESQLVDNIDKSKEITATSIKIRIPRTYSEEAYNLYMSHCSGLDERSHFLRFDNVEEEIDYKKCEEQFFERLIKYNEDKVQSGIIISKLSEKNIPVQAIERLVDSAMGVGYAEIKIECNDHISDRLPVIPLQYSGRYPLHDENQPNQYLLFTNTFKCYGKKDVNSIQELEKCIQDNVAKYKRG